MKIKTTLLEGICSCTIAVSFLGFTSCRTSDTENNLVQGAKAQVNINFIGTAFKDDNLSSQASFKSTRLNANAGKEQSHSLMITPSTVLVTTLAPLKSKLYTQAGLKNSLAVVSGNPLNNGTKFRVIAYKAADGSYQTYQDYTIGVAPQPMTLDTGVTYNIVAYSYGTSSLPTITSGETSNIGSAQIAYNNNSRDLMYVKQPYTPSSTNTTLNFTLMHQLAQITTRVRTNAGTLNSIQNALLIPHFSDGSFSLNTGVMTGSTTSAPQSIDFTANTFPVVANTFANASPVLINANTTGNQASISADINIGGSMKNVNFANTFDITPGTQNTLTVDIVKCGAYINPTTFKDFQCQNLGVTATDPFAVVKENHGAKYQWGYKPTNPNLSDNRYYTQADDQNNSGTITGWNTTIVANGSWNTGTEAIPAKNAANDPCPTGYRVPTNTEWLGVVNTARNFKEDYGTNWTASPTNFGSVLRIHDTNAAGAIILQLPATGGRNYTDGNLLNRGSFGYYWSSTEFGASNAYAMYFGLGSITVGNNFSRPSGAPVRCIAE
ncbi:FISUMP domain-containing protein [Elizabethkingia anophelis]|uniref:FISUMP domain-containing protein n=1 Tax=Elizabethkingia anophelis TaxID=1117645 RepID=UPI0038911C11